MTLSSKPSKREEVGVMKGFGHLTHRTVRGGVSRDFQPPFAEYRSDPLLLMNFKLAELGSAFEKRRFRRNCSPLHN